MKPDCKSCKYFRFSKTLGSPDLPVWHCRDGLSPFVGYLNTFLPPVWYDCRDECRSNDKFYIPIQLTFNFIENETDTD